MLNAIFEENKVFLISLAVILIILVLILLVSNYNKKSAIHIWTALFKYDYPIYFEGRLLDKYRLNYNDFKRYSWDYKVNEEMGIIDIYCVSMIGSDNVVNILPIIENMED